jgi:hypothetical protein
MQWPNVKGQAVKQERIYQALNSWKEKCYSDNEHEMVQILCKAYSDYC